MVAVHGTAVQRAEGAPARPAPRRPKFGSVTDIAKLRPDEQRAYEVSERGRTGLVVRVEPSGRKVFRWYVNALDHVATLGPWAPAAKPGHLQLKDAKSWLLRLKEAREGGLEALKQVEKELKDSLEPPPPVAPSAAGPTLRESMEGWLGKLARDEPAPLEGDDRLKHPQQARQYLERDVFGVIGSIPLASLRRSHCRDLVEAVYRRSPATGAKVLDLLRQWGEHQEQTGDDEAFVSPVGTLRKKHFRKEQKKDKRRGAEVRNRYMRPDELRMWWKALGGVSNPRTRAAFKLLILTAIRPSALRLARWEQLDFAEGKWSVPPENMKSGRPFAIPLSTLALSVFKELRALSEAEAEAEGRQVAPWVLASERGTTGHYSMSTLNQAMTRLVASHAGLGAYAKTLRVPADIAKESYRKLSAYDCRRTCRTLMREVLREQNDVCEAYLDHGLREIVGPTAHHYDHGARFEERKEAGERWAQYVLALVEGGK